MNRISTLLLSGLVALAVAPVRASDATAEEAKANLAKAVKFVQSSGEEKAFAAFNDKAGAFTKGELYIFAYSLEGVCLAHGQNPKIIGKNRMDIEDVNGVKYIALMLDGAKTKGTGQVEYMFKNPESGKIDPKITFFNRVPGKDVVLGCGIYK